MSMKMQKIGELVGKYKLKDTDKYVSREFQKYGYDLADELGELKNRSLYIKLAKETPRGLLEAARSFVKDAQHVQSRPRLFMWKLSQLKKELEEKKLNKEDKNVG